MRRRLLLASTLLLAALTLSPLPVRAQRLSSVKAEGRFDGPGLRGEFELEAILPLGGTPRGQFETLLHAFRREGTFVDILRVEGKVEGVEFQWARSTAVVSGNCNVTARSSFGPGHDIPPFHLLQLTGVPFRVIVTDRTVQFALQAPELDGLPGDATFRDGQYKSPVSPARVEFELVPLRLTGVATIAGNGLQGMLEVDASVGSAGDAFGHIRFVAQDNDPISQFRLEYDGAVTGLEIDPSRRIARIVAEVKVLIKTAQAAPPIQLDRVRLDALISGGGPGPGFFQYSFPELSARGVSHAEETLTIVVQRLEFK